MILQTEKCNPCPVSPSPCPRVSASPRLRVSASPCLLPSPLSLLPSANLIAGHHDLARCGRGGAAAGFNADGEPFRAIDANLRGKLHAHTAGGIGGEHTAANRNGQLGIDEPQLIALRGRQWRKIFHHEQPALLLSAPDGGADGS